MLKRSLVAVVSILLLSLSLNGQVKGDGKIQSQEFSIAGVTDIVCAIYADIEIDATGSDYMTIIADANLLPLIDTEVIDGRLILQQKEWIQGSQRIKIRISARHLRYVSQEVHEHLKLINLNQSELRAVALLGSISLDGQVTRLFADAESGDINATELNVSEVIVNIWDDGRIEIQDADVIKGKIKKDAIVHYEGEVKSIELSQKGDSQIHGPGDGYDPAQTDVKYINVKLNNNSSKWISAFVRGPKPDGKHFSYGFNLSPGQTRKERWTVGTKVYKQSMLGIRKKLVEIESSDENKTVQLFSKLKNNSK